MKEENIQTNQYSKSLVLLITGIFAVLLFELYLSYSQSYLMNIGDYYFFLFLALLFGFLFRTLRRWIFFRHISTFHACFSFESIFQGAYLLNPQLLYPQVESAFLRKEMGKPSSKIIPWFHVRTLSSIAVPITLIAVSFSFFELVYSSILAFTSLLLSMYFALYFTNWSKQDTSRLALSIFFGVSGVIIEGLLFSFAVEKASVQGALSFSFFSYIFLLITYELTPIPLALGSVEFIFLILFLMLGNKTPHFFFFASYRFFRALPTFFLMFFYLSRYKLKIIDLFSLSLPRALKQVWSEAKESDAKEYEYFLSIIIPAFNESQRLPKFLPKIISFCEHNQNPIEIILVDDGSHDHTSKYAEKIAAEHTYLKVYKNLQNEGKGAAVKLGISHANGRYVMFIDADGSTPVNEIHKLIKEAEKGADVVIATRNNDFVQRSLFREIFGTFFYRITNLLAVPGISDTQCGCKLFRSQAANSLFSKSQEKGWLFDVEILFLAQKFSMVIVEVQVNWKEVKGSKVSPIKDGFNAIIALFRIRKRWAGMVDKIYDQ